MEVHVAVRAGSADAIAAVLSTAAGLTEGILWTKVAAVSDAFECGSGVCAVVRVRTAMEAASLWDWFAAAGREAARDDAAFRIDVLLAEDTELHGDIDVPSPLIALGEAVVTPLLDLDPDVRMPDGRRVADVAEGRSVLVRVGPVPGFERLPEPPKPATVPGAETPQWDDAFGWAAATDDWVPVAWGWGWHKDVEIRLALLLDAGIPACLHDRPFGELQGWLWGQVVPSAILVAPEALEDARGMLAAPFDDDGGVFAAAGTELEGLRHGPRYRLLRAGLWAYLLIAWAPMFILEPATIGLLVIVLAVVLL